MFEPERGGRINGYVIYKYKEAFSLRDEIGTCPSIEIEIYVIDKSLFLLDHTM